MSSGHTPCVRHCREKAKGATFFEATEGETVKPMLDVSWAPMLGAFSVLFEANSEGGPEAAHKWCLICCMHPFWLANGLFMVAVTFVLFVLLYV